MIDKWMDVSGDGELDGWVNGRRNRRRNRWTDVNDDKDVKIDGWQMKGQMNGLMDELLHE